MQAAFHDGDAGMLRYAGQGSLPDAIEFYDRMLPTHGWSREPVTGFAAGPAIRASVWRREGAQLSLAVCEIEGSLFIQITSRPVRDTEAE